jgi:hypothetical protein
MMLTTVDLRIEAKAEVRRLTSARALVRDRDEHALASLEGGATWITMSRRPGLRRSLRGRVCLVWRVALEDTSGRVVASKLLPVLVEVRRGAGRRSPSWIREVLQHADGLLRARVEDECESWRVEAMRVAHAFSSARLRREREIAAPADCGHLASQPGLFDRRTERSRAARASTAAESERAAAERRRAIAAAARIAPAPARLLLVLVA